MNDTHSVTLENDDKGPCLIVDTKYSHLAISLFGGHVLSFINKKDNKDRLWLSNKAIFDGKTPIRGGIPICWPWFSSHQNEPSFVNHGFARTQIFRLLDITEALSEREVTLTKLTLIPSELDLFGYTGLQMKLVVEISDTLNISIISMNNSKTSILLTQALHTYLRVDDIKSTFLKGVTTDFYDKPSNTFGNKAPIPYTFKGEVDRIHEHLNNGYTQSQFIEVLSNVARKDDIQSPIVEITQTGHDSTVVWNPWKEKSIAMKDMQNDGYLTMLCIEAANTSNAKYPLQLAPNKIHKLSQTIY